MMDKEHNERVFAAIRRRMEKARTWIVRFHPVIEETSQPGDAWATFEPTDQMTITIEINKPDDEAQQDEAIQEHLLHRT